LEDRSICKQLLVDCYTLILYIYNYSDLRGKEDVPPCIYSWCICKIVSRNVSNLIALRILYARFTPNLETAKRFP